MDDRREQRIRERAHQIWEREGRPDGQEQSHWERASREIDEEDRLTDASSSRTWGHKPRNDVDDSSGGKNKA